MVSAGKIEVFLKLCFPRVGCCRTFHIVTKIFSGPGFGPVSGPVYQRLLLKVKVRQSAKASAIFLLNSIK
jgi:hypothetical protein